MKVAIIGAGAMGSLFGGYLSRSADVTLIDTDGALVAHVRDHGLVIREADGREERFYPGAATSARDLDPVELVILFVKALHSRTALEANRELIGEHTLLLTLQNGAGHEDLLREFAGEDRIVIGTTQHNCAVLEPGTVRHGGGGDTFLGVTAGNSEQLRPVAALLSSCGFPTVLSREIGRMVWKKLLVNTSVSALTGVLQTKMGFMADNPHGRRMLEQLLEEAVVVANSDGCAFDLAEVTNDVLCLIEGSREGVTSICADLRDGRRTEVDTISGAVVRIARRNGVPAPLHQWMVEMIHAIEDKNDAKGSI